MKKHKALRVLLILSAVLAAWLLWTNVRFETTHISIENEKIPAAFDGFKIAEAADLHNHPWGRRLIDRLRAEQPDLIAVTGDLVDSSHTDTETAMEFIREAVKIAPVYYVTGNHEAWLDDYGSLEAQLRGAGVHMMDDRTEWLERGGARICIAGVQDPDFVEGDFFEGVQAAVVQKKLEPLADVEEYCIVLCHRPERFEEYVQAGADLALTGHAHGGQVRIPFVGGLIAPNQGFFPKYTEGVYHENQTDMVVSRGLGNSVIPVRINNTPELVIVTLKH